MKLYISFCFDAIYLAVSCGPVGWFYLRWQSCLLRLPRLQPVMPVKMFVQWKSAERCGLLPKKGLRSQCVMTGCTIKRPEFEVTWSSSLGDFFFIFLNEVWRIRINVCEDLFVQCPSSLISLNTPRLQLAWNFNFPGNLINPYNFQGRLVKTDAPMVAVRWRHLQWKCLVFQPPRSIK